MQKIFGTDGARGVYGVDITPKLAFDMGRALAVYTKAEKNILIAKDTRDSCDVLLTAFASGAMSVGANVVCMGLVTTPCLSYTTRYGDFACGVMITASHNSCEYNGIKIFKSNGEKLGEKEEKELTDIYENIDSICKKQKFQCGKFVVNNSLIKKYIKYLKSFINDNCLNKSIAFDCANGVSHVIIKKIFDKNNKNIYLINTSQEGNKVNKNCGATDPKSLSNFVVKNKIDIGFAFDGDGDRIIAVDNRGQIIDGDDILYNLAIYLKGKKALNKNVVVGTSMTNMALEKAFYDGGIQIERVDVGDKYIVDRLVKEKLSLGGEKAGHIIPYQYTNTGDGVLVALLLAKIANERAIEKIKNCPQKIVNIECSKKAKDNILSNIELKNFIQTIKDKYINYRVVVRPSGTENKIRIMVEGEKTDNVEDIIKQITDNILKLL